MKDLNQKEMNFNLYKSGLSLFTFILYCSSCTNSPAINDKYDFISVSSFRSNRLKKVSSDTNLPLKSKFQFPNLIHFLLLPKQPLQLP